MAGDNPDPEWMQRIGSIDEVEASWFSEGKVPTCPFGERYAIIEGDCQSHSHLGESRLAFRVASLDVL